MKLTDFTNLINEDYLKYHGTKIIGGFSEPLYLPGQESQLAEIRFTRDYFRSALHELAHWCVAGEERRKKVDYGYWYVPDGRTQSQQNEFYACEIKPQAVEWALSAVCGVKFDVSVDNIYNDVTGVEDFNRAVSIQSADFLKKGFPVSAVHLLQLLFSKTGGSTRSVYRFLEHFHKGSIEGIN